MSKTHINLTVEHDLLEQVRRYNINMSGEFEKLLTQLVAFNQDNVEGISRELLIIDINKLKSKKSQIDIELSSKLKSLEMIDEMIKKKEEVILQEKKESIEAKRKCINCGLEHNEEIKFHTFKKGLVCNFCYLKSNTKQIVEWMKQ